VHGEKCKIEVSGENVECIVNGVEDAEENSSFNWLTVLRGESWKSGMIPPRGSQGPIIKSGKSGIEKLLKSKGG
jgi:hypothetical protein